MEKFTIEQLSKYNLTEIRKPARTLRAPSPTSGRKEEIIDRILRLQSGELAPSQETRGKKPNDSSINGEILPVSPIETQYALQSNAPALELEKEEITVLPPSVIDAQFTDDSYVGGALEIMPEGHGFLRVNNFYNSNGDIYVQQKHISCYGLRSGDFLYGRVRKFENSKLPSMIYIETVNGLTLDKLHGRPNFDFLKAAFPDRRIKLENSGNRLDFALRAIDLIAPVGMGQRALIVSPPKAGKTVLLKKVAQAIRANDPDIHVMMLLIDERPEEVTDMEDSVDCEIASSTFDQSPIHHIKVSDLALKRAKRLVEAGKNVVILLDSITRLARAYNTVAENTGRTMSGGLDAAALVEPKKFFGSARNIKDGGSLTIIATALVDTGSRMDDIIYEEFKGTGNMEIHLDRRLSEKRIFPAIDMNASGTRREDLLLSEKEMQGIWLVRRLLSKSATMDATEMLIDLLTKTISNDEFIDRLNESQRFDKW
jgi:transcription termination factor Rho